MPPKLNQIPQDKPIYNWMDVKDDDGQDIIPVMEKQTDNKCLSRAIKTVLESRYRINWIQNKTYSEEKRHRSVDLQHMLSITGNSVVWGEVSYQLEGSLLKAENSDELLYRYENVNNRLWTRIVRQEEGVEDAVLDDLRSGPLIGFLYIDEDYLTTPEYQLWSCKDSFFRVENGHAIPIVGIMHLEYHAHYSDPGERFCFIGIEGQDDGRRNKFKFIESTSLRSYAFPIVTELTVDEALNNVIRRAVQQGDCVIGLKKTKKYLKDQKRNVGSGLIDRIRASLVVLAEGFESKTQGLPLFNYCNQIDVLCVANQIEAHVLGNLVGSDNNCHCLLIKEGEEAEEARSYDVLRQFVKDN